MITLDIRIDAGDWAGVGDLDALLPRAAEAAVAVSPEKPSGAISATLLLTDDRAVRDLNRAWRGQDKPTNVLSFPASSPRTPNGPLELGDLVLAFETVTREALDEHKSVADHAAHLVVHGVLHLLGHDHLDDEDAHRMERLEAAALASIGISDPYEGSIPLTGDARAHAS